MATALANTPDRRKESPVPADRTPSAYASGLPALVARHAERTPQALAVMDGDTTLTYAQLVTSARTLAAHLHDHGVRPGDRVALLVPRSARALVAQLALWWAGAACVPLDPAHPRPRTEAMLTTAGATLTVGDSKLLESTAPTGATLALPEDPLLTGAELPAVEPGPNATALVLFTSGSTGLPKGVTVTHGGIAQLVTAPQYATVTARDRVFFHSPATFDASTFEVWSALANGAAVVVCTVERPSSRIWPSRWSGTA